MCLMLKSACGERAMFVAVCNREGRRVQGCGEGAFVLSSKVAPALHAKSPGHARAVT